MEAFEDLGCFGFCHGCFRVSGLLGTQGFKEFMSLGFSLALWGFNDLCLKGLGRAARTLLLRGRFKASLLSSLTQKASGSRQSILRYLSLGY